MKYNLTQMGFILYNNRSVENVVTNFVDMDMDMYKLMEIEDTFDDCKSKYDNDDRMVEINVNDLNTDLDDIKVSIDDVMKLTEIFKKNKGKFNINEANFLKDRNISDDIIFKYGLLGLSNITKYDDLVTIGATIHPILSNILSDDIENGGILIPLYENNILVNSTVRKIGIENNGHSKTLKYSQACPDVSIWFLDDVKNGDHIWITEGIFDSIALREMGVKAISVSSAIFSGIQLYKLLDKRPGKVTIFSDNDEVGIRSSFIMKEFLNNYNIECNIVKSIKYKDPSDHYFKHNMNINDVVELKEFDIKLKDNSFDFLKYLKDRNF